MPFPSHFTLSPAQHSLQRYTLAAAHLRAPPTSPSRLQPTTVALPPLVLYPHIPPWQLIALLTHHQHQHNLLNRDQNPCGRRSPHFGGVSSGQGRLFPSKDRTANQRLLAFPAARRRIEGVEKVALSVSATDPCV